MDICKNLLGPLERQKVYLFVKTRLWTKIIHKESSTLLWTIKNSSVSSSGQSVFFFLRLLITTCVLSLMVNNTCWNYDRNESREFEQISHCRFYLHCPLGQQYFWRLWRVFWIFSLWKSPNTDLMTKKIFVFSTHTGILCGSRTIK